MQLIVVSLTCLSSLTGMTSHGFQLCCRQLVVPSQSFAVFALGGPSFDSTQLTLKYYRLPGACAGFLDDSHRHFPRQSCDKLTMSLTLQKGLSSDFWDSSSSLHTNLSSRTGVSSTSHIIVHLIKAPRNDVSEKVADKLWDLKQPLARNFSQFNSCSSEWVTVRYIPKMEREKAFKVTGSLVCRVFF
jgi:hypothetical protein